MNKTITPEFVLALHPNSSLFDLNCLHNTKQENKENQIAEYFHAYFWFWCHVSNKLTLKKNNNNFLTNIKNMLTTKTNKLTSQDHQKTTKNKNYNKSFRLEKA